jgi:hypothetical protein
MSTMEDRLRQAAPAPPGDGLDARVHTLLAARPTPWYRRPVPLWQAVAGCLVVALATTAVYGLRCGRAEWESAPAQAPVAEAPAEIPKEIKAPDGPSGWAAERRIIVCLFDETGAFHIVE